MRFLETFRPAALASVVALGACGSSTDGADGGAATPTFVAHQSDFQGYKTWRSFPFDAPDPQGGVHTMGPRIEYINPVPPHGATSFPVGTVIVKDILPHGIYVGNTFAMVKRGGGYNPDGARDWEWFELKNDGGNTTIVWHGSEPPPGEMYGADPTGGCNSCHSGAMANDFVKSQALQLANF
jgi:hypothetical protein